MSSPPLPDLIPPALQKGQTIAFLSPSSRLNHIFPARISRAASWFESQGFNIKVIYSQLSSSSSHAAQIGHRVSEVHSAFADPSIHAIVCTIGGVTANKLLRHLDYDLIRANPKIFCGMSDITPLHHALYAKAGLRTLYGPAAITDFAEAPEPNAFMAENFFRNVVVGSENAGGGARAVPRSLEFSQEFLDWGTPELDIRARRYEPSPGWKWLRKGKARAAIYGGCLPSLNRIANSEWWPDYTGKILLLETPEGESAPDAIYTPEQAEMDLCDLRNYGVLDEVVGIVVGRPLYYDEEMRAKLERIIVNETEGLEIPILANVDVGHTSPKITVPLGVLAELDSEGDRFEFLERGVR